MPLPVISVEQMREWEKATWASGQTEESVIARVGKDLATRALRLTRPHDLILLLAGKGHNGDDVRAMRPHLVGRTVHELTIHDPALAIAELTLQLARRPALVVDGLFGIGLTRPLSEDWRAIIRLVNEARRPVLAVDVPSGLDAATGQPRPEAIRATLTVTVGAPKAGLLTAGAGDFVGKLEVTGEVGLVPCPITGDVQWTLDEDLCGFPPPRPATGHKGTFGHATLIAGSLGYHGAAVLAARGAQRAGPGLVTLMPQPDVYEPVAAQLQAVMVRPWSEGGVPSNTTALLFGPGLAAANVPAALRDEFLRAWRTGKTPLVVDASALDWLPREAPGGDAVRVITPHPGEAARLLDVTVAEVQRDRVAALRTLARRYGCWVVLKGARTLIGAADGPVAVNSSGNAGLAQGGSGDVLAGYIAGWLAQPLARAEVATLLRFAVLEHGRAADRLQARRSHWTIEELATELGATTR